MLTSLCVCSWERTNHLPQVFQAIARHASPPYEVVVVDDASKNPEIRTLLAYFQNLFMKQGIPFTVSINERNVKHAASQNKSWALAKGDVLIHIEDDIIVPYDHWNQTMAKFLVDHPEVGQVAPEGSGRGEWIPRGPYNEYAWALGGLFAVKRSVFEKIGGWDEHLWHQVEPDYNLRVRMAGWRLAEVQGVRMVHLGEGEADNTFRRQAQIIVGVHQFLMKWNTRTNGFWDYDSLLSLSWDDIPANQFFRRELAAWFAAEAAKLEDRYRGLGVLKEDPNYANAVPENVKKLYNDLKRCELNSNSNEWKFPGHWGAYELINVIRPRGREREKELITLMKNNHVFTGARRVEQQLRDLAKRMNYDLKEDELKELSSKVPTRYEWAGNPIYE